MSEAKQIEEELEAHVDVHKKALKIHELGDEYKVKLIDYLVGTSEEKMPEMTIISAHMSIQLAILRALKDYEDYLIALDTGVQPEPQPFFLTDRIVQYYQHYQRSVHGYGFRKFIDMAITEVEAQAVAEEGELGDQLNFD